VALLLMYAIGSARMPESRFYTTRSLGWVGLRPSQLPALDLSPDVQQR
jgi:hypothetical protein